MALKYALWYRNLTHVGILYKEMWSIHAQLCMNIHPFSQPPQTKQNKTNNTTTITKNKFQQTKLKLWHSPDWKVLALYQSTSIFDSNRWGLFTGESCAHTFYNRDATTHLLLTINDFSTAVFQNILNQRTRVKMGCTYLLGLLFSYLECVSQKTKVGKAVGDINKMIFSSPLFLRKYQKLNVFIKEKKPHRF